MSEEEWEYDEGDSDEADYHKAREQDAKDEMIDTYNRSGRQDDEFETEMGLKSTLKIIKIQDNHMSEYKEEAGDYFVMVNNEFIHHLLIKKDKQSIFLISYDKTGKQLITKYIKEVKK